jgi:hypothetical protein
MPTEKTRRRRRALPPAIAAAAIVALGAIASAPADAATFTVTNTNDSGAGSLRQAIDDANANVGVTDAIEFNIPGVGGHVITPASDLPAIADPVNVRGYLQPGSVPATATATAVIKIWIDATNELDGLDVETDDSSISGLVIENSGGDGIRVVGNRNRVRGNHIGTSENNTTFLNGNAGDGIDITGDDNAVGSAAAQDRNVIAANGLLAGNSDADGIRVAGDGNKVEGNTIGANPELTTDQVGNRGAGVHVVSGANNHVGETAAGAGNVIVANGDAAIDIAGTATRVMSNLVGTDATGQAGYGNGRGVVVESTSSRNVIGSTVGGSGNVIAGTNSGPGLVLDGDRNVVQHNVVGTDAGETTELPNLGGIGVTGSFNVIGGQTVDTGNVLSANDFYGIRIDDASDPKNGVGNLVWGNDIGTDDAAKADLGNDGDGVEILGGDANMIGGSGRDGGKANVIAHNHGAGVSVVTGADDAILQDRIFDNDGLGIDLAGDGLVQANDAGDADTGPNGLQNFPLITAVSTAAGVTTVDWDISDFAANAKASTELDFYASNACDASGNGEGETLVGSTVLPAGTAAGLGSTAMAVPVATGKVVTVIATTGAGVPLLPGRTSEFSPCFAA